MKSIKKYVEQLEEELEGAQDYAERYVECKAKGNMTRANRFKEMATDELKHCGYIHEMAVQEIEDIKKVYTAPVEMQEKWEKAHKIYIEKAAWIKQMLTL
jgi:fructose-1,6-bisphosphatase